MTEAPASATDELVAEREVRRLRALLEHVAEVVDVALDVCWHEAIDVLLDLSDEIHAKLRP